MKFYEFIESLQSLNPNKIIMIKTGAFFNSIGRDAIILEKILGLKIVGDHYDDVTMKQILLRQGVMILLVEGSIYTASNMLHQMINVITGFNFASLYAYIGVVISLISVICVFVFKSKKSLHDIVAKTLVVDIKSPQYTYEVKKNKKIRKKKLKLS